MKTQRWLAATALAGILIATGEAALAQSTGAEAALLLCRQVATDADRLACYDGIGGAPPPAPPPAAVEIEPIPSLVAQNTTGKWRIDKSMNPVDDTATVSVSLQADEGEGPFGDPIVFVARCQSNATEAYIVWHDYLASDGSYREGDWKNVTIRIGEAPAEKQRWSTSTDSQATFAPRWAGDLLKAMAGTNRFVAQVTPYNESPVTAVFDTSGMASALSTLAATCGWSL